MNLFYLIQIGFLDITIWDLLDILIVGFVLFQIYKLLKGSLGFNIFIGLVLVFLVWWVVSALEMPLLSSILGQFVSVGFIALLILFQPEVRRFLLFLGQGSFVGRFQLLGRFFKNGGRLINTNNIEKERKILAVTRATETLMRDKTGALILFSANANLEGLYSSGVLLNAEVSKPLILSIFNKTSPLHDGAVIITEGKLVAASCVLPISDNPMIPQELGLRHRAGVGITVSTDVIAFIVSEETGKLSYARGGALIEDIKIEEMQRILQKLTT